MTIIAENLVKKYKGRRVVDGVSISISQREIVGLLGPNGAGKTTTFYMVTGLVRPDGGDVKLDAQDMTRWPMYQRARAGLGYLPQEASVFRKLSVRDNLRLVLELTNASKTERENKIDAIAEHMHIRHILGSTGNVLSGGERRRVEIARALVTDPKFILLDEPFTGIDPVTIEEIQGIIQRLKTQGIGVLITDHNILATLRITDRNYILIDGKIQIQGSAQDIMSDKNVRDRFLGESFGDEWLD